MVDKNSFNIHTFNIAKRNGITETAVSAILHSYINELHNELKNNRSINLIGLCRIQTKSDVYSTTALIGKSVASKTGISYITCTRVICDFLDFLRKDLSNKMAVEIRTLVAITPVVADDGQVSYHSSLSGSIKRDVSDARAHTSNLLKSKLRGTSARFNA